MSYDFIIAGGGIGGTVLAHLLGKAGRKVLVLEKSVAPPTFIRPEGLWPRTAELLRSILPRKDAGTTWLPLQGLRAFDGQNELVSIRVDVFQRGGLQLSLTDPNWTREQLMRLKTFELRRGIEVTSVIKEKSRIAGVKAKSADGKEEEFLAPFTIGDDGVNSRVREGCGIPLKTSLFPVDFMTFGFTWPQSLPAATVHLFLNKKRSKAGFIGLVAMPMPQGKGAALVPARPAALEPNSKASQIWNEFAASDARLTDVIGTRQFPQDLTRVRRPWGHADSYGANGAALIGDAAHPVSPVGGQGANMAVADASALADVILSGSKNIVADYERRRRPANERSINFTRDAARALNMPAFIVDPMIPVFMRRLKNNFDEVLRTAANAFQD